MNFCNACPARTASVRERKCSKIETEIIICDYENACLAAAIVFPASSRVCAALKNAASNCDGGKYIPASSIARKNLPNAIVSHLEAEFQSVTGPAVKNHVNIDPTRL